MKNGWIKVINLGGRIQYINSRNINYVIDYEEDGNSGIFFDTNDYIGVNMNADSIMKLIEEANEE